MKRLVTYICVSVLTITMVFGFSFVSSQIVSACSCVQPGTPSESLVQADAVFLGRVVSTENMGDLNVNYTFEVRETWKGVNQQSINVSSANNSAACGNEFQSGNEYLVYAFESEDGLSTNLCTRTTSIESAFEDLTELGQGDVISDYYVLDDVGMSNNSEDNVILFAAAVVIVSVVVIGAGWWFMNKKK